MVKKVDVSDEPEPLSSLADTHLIEHRELAERDENMQYLSAVEVVGMR